MEHSLHLLCPIYDVILVLNIYIATILAITENKLLLILVEPRIDTFEIDDSLIEYAITTKTKAICIVHLYGQCAYTKKYVFDYCGLNSRLDEIPAAMLRVKLKHLDECNAYARAHIDRWHYQSCHYHAISGRLGCKCISHLFYSLHQSQQTSTIPFRKRHSNQHPLPYSSTQSEIPQRIQQYFITNNRANSSRKIKTANESSGNKR